MNEENKGLSDLELEILRSIPAEGRAEPRAYAAWYGKSGDVEMGPVRFRRETSDGVRYECSPFPGSWDLHVPENAILRVRHLGALSI